MAKHALLTREQLHQALRELSVQPFVERLGRLLEAGPTPEELQDFARRKPGDWAGMVKVFANLAGYAERKEVKVAGILGHIGEMSDAELLERARLVGGQKALDFQPDLSDIGSKVEEAVPVEPS